jgi:hypothetical protein
MKPNTNFTLDVNDIEIIENALRAQPASKEVQEVLAKLYHQKVWYRPKNKFVGGG